MRNLNLFLLSSWIFRYGLQSDSIWVKIVDYKYNIITLMCCAVMTLQSLLFGEAVLCGLYKLLKWGSNG